MGQMVARVSKLYRVLCHYYCLRYLTQYLYVLFEAYLIPIFQSLKENEEQGIKVLVMGIFSSIMPAITIFLFGFFGFLHCWLNCWAEILQFAGIFLV